MTSIDRDLDWATDYDIFDPAYVRDPFPIWDSLRAQGCPVAHSERYGSAWLPVDYADVQAMAKIVPELSSDEPTVVPLTRILDEDDPTYGVSAPPISSDPPEHTWARRLILPYFSPRAVEDHRPFTEQLCHRLVDDLEGRDVVDGAAEYAQQIPPRVIAHMMGFDEARVDEFVEWVRGVLEIGLTDPEVRLASRQKLMEYLFAEVADRQANPRDDFISFMLAATHDGEPVHVKHVIGTCNLMLIAGIDTTWSSIGSALWHLAGHPEDRRRLVAEPELVPTATEELLRAYAPVTMARIATADVEVAGVHIREGDRVLMNFPAANRDPKVFERADEVVIDRERNRHVAFGSGIHRCAGSNLARMEMNVALGVFLERLPEFSLADPDAVTWAGGQVRGPRRLPLRLSA